MERLPAAPAVQQYERHPAAALACRCIRYKAPQVLAMFSFCPRVLESPFAGTPQAVNRAGQTAERVFSNPAGTEQSKEAAQKLSDANSEIPRALAGGAQKVLPSFRFSYHFPWCIFLFAQKLSDLWSPSASWLAAPEVPLHSGFTVSVYAMLRLQQVQSRPKQQRFRLLHLLGSESKRHCPSR